MCVDMYMVANLILLCSLKHISLIWNLKIPLQENMGYLIHLFFSGGHISTHCFQYLGHLSIFSILFFSFMNNFCIAHASFSAIETFQKRHLQELGAFILSNLFFVSIPSIGVEHFWVDGKHVFAYSQCRSSRYMWSVCDLDLGSMISFSTRVTRLDQTQYNDK